MSILKREVFYSTKDGKVQFLDWARTTTTLGVMAEPFTMNDRKIPTGPDDAQDGIQDFDPSDIMVKVDALQRTENFDSLKRDLFADQTGRQPLHGGNLWPRVLIFTGNDAGSTQKAD